MSPDLEAFIAELRAVRLPDRRTTAAVSNAGLEQSGSALDILR
jgi:hypothetical protein